ncbi:MAG TPA: LysR family transcriptional regulator [Solirubrobacteraceae bacterium]|jgi:DNA-binding transcriptional LysR family regulator|nr:LysR family transcriptional regulator [Solirubrobacteraceae bacterium]
MPKRGALEYFVAVVQEGQMTSAARRLGIAQSALSQAIAQLETEVGVKLLERHPRGVTPTRAGEKLYAKARLAVSASADALSAARSLARAQRGTIEFGFLGAPPALDSPAEMKAFARAFPEIDIRYRELPFPSHDTASWLSGVDVAVCNSPPPNAAVWTKVLRTERRVLLIPEGNPLAACSELRAEQALGETFVDFHPSVDPAWAGFWSLDDERGGPPERVTGDRVANPQEVLAALAIRSAVTVVPAAVAAVVSGLIEDVRAVPIVDSPPARICLVGHLERLNPLVGALLAFAGGGQPPSTSGRQLRPGPL